MRLRWRIPRLRRRRVLRILAVLAVLPVALGGYLLGTTSGARQVLALALKRSPVPISIERIEGRLAGPLHLWGIVVRTPVAEVEIGHVELDWAPAGLLRRQLHVERFLVEDVESRLLPPPAADPAAEPKPAAAPQPPPDIPLQIVIDEARAVRVRLLLAEEVELADLHFLMRGRPDDYRIEAATRLVGAAMPPTALELQVHGNLSALTVEPLTVRTLDGAVVVRAEAAWYPAITWQATVTADSLAVGRLAPQPEQWPGRIGAVLNSAGQLVDGLPRGWATLDTLHGQLRGRELGGSGRVEFAGPRQVSANFALAWAAVTARLAADIGDSLRADLQLACADLGSLLPGAGGSFNLATTASGPLATPQAAVTCSAQDLVLPEGAGSVAAAGAELALDLADGGSGRLDLRLDGIAAGTAVLDSVVVTAAGTRAEHRLRLALAGPQVEALLAVAGGLAPDTLAWTGSLDSLALANPLAGRWRLRAPVALTASATHASVDSLWLTQGAAALGLSADWDDGAWAARGGVEHLPLDLANPELPPEQQLHGTVEATFAASGLADGTVRGRLAAALAEARLVFATAAGPDSLVFEDAALHAGMGDSGVAVDFALVLAAPATGARVDLAGDLALPEYTNLRDDPGAQPLRATLRGSLPDLGVFAGLDPRVTGLAGSIAVDAQAGGTVAAPEGRGELRAEGVTVTLPDLGITIRNGAFTASGDPTAGLTLDGGAESGEGSIHIGGRVPPQPSVDDPVLVTITGERFEGVATPEVEVLVSPDLQITYDGSKLLVGGEVTLPVVQVELVEVPATAVPVSRDAVIVGQDAGPAALPVDTWIDVRVTLGDEVAFRGFAMSIELEGGLQVQQHVPKPPSVRGEIRIRDGYYRAYGQNLTIDRGLISFVGPAENPNLDMRAYRTAPDGVIAGVVITGTAESPTLRVYSEPALSETQAISYLLTGRSLDAGSGVRIQVIYGSHNKVLVKQFPSSTPSSPSTSPRQNRRYKKQRPRTYPQRWPTGYHMPRDFLSAVEKMKGAVVPSRRWQYSLSWQGPYRRLPRYSPEAQKQSLSSYIRQWLSSENRFPFVPVRPQQ